MKRSYSQRDSGESEAIRNVVMVVPNLTQGGAQRTVTAIASALVQRGLEVSIITYWPPSRSDYQLDARVQRYWLSTSGLTNRIGLLRELRRVVSIRRLLRRLHPDATVAFLRSPTVITTIAGLGLPHARVGSIRIHPPASSPHGRLEKLAHRITINRMDAVVVLTNETRDWFRSKYPMTHVEVIPNMVGITLPARGGGEHTASPSLKVLAAGRLTPQKGFDLLLRAAAETLPRYPAAQLTILGEGPQRAQLEALRDRLGLTHSVDLPGRVTNIEAWYQDADLFVLSSRYEGFPNVLIEAMAAGLAVISTDCPTGPRDIITDGANGLLVPIEDVSALAKALDGLLSEPERLQQLGTAAQGVRQSFGSDRIVQRWIDLLEKAKDPR